VRKLEIAQVSGLRRPSSRNDDNLVRLLAPPFDRIPRDPGYIKAYSPGIRESDGQYTSCSSLACHCGCAQP